MTRRRPDETLEIPIADAMREREPLTDPPTMITNVKDVIELINQPERWTATVLSGSSSGLVMSFDPGETTVGRGSTATMRVRDEGLSREHAVFILKDNVLSVNDLGSTNGTFVDNARIAEPTVLESGSRVQLGSTVVRIQLQSPAEVAASRALYESSVRDPLTGVYNRRHLDERMVAEFAYAVRHRIPLSLMMIDADHFKNINDTFGHQAGDEVLRRLGAFLLNAVRQEDLVARFGGEEFVVMLRGIAAGGAEILAQRIRQGIENLTLDWGGKPVRFTVSIGVSTHAPTRVYSNEDALLAAADDCVYRAKVSGRNLVICDASPRSVPPG